MMPLSRTGFALLVFITTAGAISTDLYLPSLPAIAVALHASQAETQATLSIFLLGFAGSMLVCGPVSDRIGRRPVLIGGLLVFAVASLGCAWAPSIHWLWLGRFIQAIGAATGPVIGRAIVRDAYGASGSVRMMPYLSASGALAPLLGPFVGGALQSLVGWQANFLFLALYGGLGAVLTWRLLPETLSAPPTQAGGIVTVIKTYALFLRDRHFRMVIQATAFTYGAIFCFLSTSSFVFIDVLGVPPHRFGLVFAVFVLGFVSGAMGGGRLAKARKPEHILLAGALLSTGAGCVLIGIAATTHGVVPLMVGIYFMNAGCGLALPIAQGLGVAPYPHAAGAASSMLNFITNCVSALTGALLAQIPTHSALPMSIFMTLCAGMVLHAGLRLRQLARVTDTFIEPEALSAEVAMAETSSNRR
jgi:DHA1 family bicyclomycin/chloramphenicol resistance-like MFS transporter